MDKVFLESLAPMKYSGEGDFQEYLNQFESTARTLCWDEEKKGSALHGRLKGRALACVSSCPDKHYSTLVRRLRDRFSPKTRKCITNSSQHTERFRSELGGSSLGDRRSITQGLFWHGGEVQRLHGCKGVCRSCGGPRSQEKTEAETPETVNEAVRHARMIEADQLREDLSVTMTRVRIRGLKSLKREDRKTRTVEATKPEGRQHKWW